jgi:transposase
MQDREQGKDKAGIGSARQIAELPVVRHRVAGIDLGSQRHWVCVPTVEGSGREVANFGATTAELIRMAKWLKERKVESVAMESTGVYWIAPHEVLEAEGLEVMLVDTRQLARVPGRDQKSDPFDCEWIQRLHSCGLLMGSFRPKEAVCMLRTLVRDKGNLVAEAGDWLRRMQKSLDRLCLKYILWDSMSMPKQSLWRWRKWVGRFAPLA